MRAKLDENMPLEAVAVLEDAGWECSTVFDEGLSGAADPRLSEACRVEGRVLFTLDLDFADIRAYPPETHPGIVALRPADPGRNSVLGLLARAVGVLTRDWVGQRLWIVEPDRIRIRGGDQTPLPSSPRLT
jgi:predicted nuclease of predicted toxin-antitoxin system